MFITRACERFKEQMQTMELNMNKLSRLHIYCLLLLVLLWPVHADEQVEKQTLVDEFMVFIDKEDYSQRLKNYHSRLILPAVEQYYTSTGHAPDAEIIEIAKQKIDEFVRRVVYDEDFIEKINRKYFSENLSEPELRAIVEILKLPKGREILLNFSDYLHQAQALRVTQGRDLRGHIEKEIYEAVKKHESEPQR